MVYSSVKKMFGSMLFGNFSSLVALQIFGYIFPIITVPYLFRTLGVEVYGLVMFATSLMAYFNIFVDFGFNLSAVRSVSVNRESHKMVVEIFNSVLWGKVLLVFVAFCVLFCCVEFLPIFKAHAALYYFSFASVIGNALFPVWFFQGIEKMRYITIISLLAKVISILPIFLLIKLPEHYLYVPLFFGAGFVLSGIFGLLVARYKFKMSIHAPKLNSIVSALKESSSYFMSRVSLSIYTATNTFLIGIILGNTAVGYFVAAEKLYQAYTALFGTLAQTLYPYMVKMRNFSLWKKVLLSASSTNVLIIITLILLAHPLIGILYGKDELGETTIVFQILMLATIITFPSILLGYPLLGAYGYVRSVNYSIVYASVFHLIGLGVLIWFNGFNLVSVAILVIISESLVLAYRFYCYKKYLL